MPIGVFNLLCAHNDEHIGVGIHCLFLLVRFTRAAELRISKGKVPRFSLYKWVVWSQPHTKNSSMKKMYHSPRTVLYSIETSILCASGEAKTSAKGSLKSIGNGSSEW